MRESSGMDAFLSYAQADQKLASKILKALEAKGVKMASDRDLVADAPSNGEVEKMMDAAESIVVLVGRGSRDRKFRDRDLTHAVEMAWRDPRKRLIPLLAPNAEMIPVLYHWHSLKMREENAAEIDRVTGEVAETIKSKRSTRAEPPHFPKKMLEEYEERLSAIEAYAKSLKALTARRKAA